MSRRRARRDAAYHRKDNRSFRAFAAIMALVLAIILILSLVLPLAVGSSTPAPGG